jgi:hypothetical protein
MSHAALSNPRTNLIEVWLCSRFYPIHWQDVVRSLLDTYPQKIQRSEAELIEAVNTHN